MNIHEFILKTSVRSARTPRSSSDHGFNFASHPCSSHAMRLLTDMLYDRTLLV